MASVFTSLFMVAYIMNTEETEKETEIETETEIEIETEEKTEEETAEEKAVRLEKEAEERAQLEALLNRIKALENIKDDAELIETLNIPGSTLRGWRDRRKPPPLKTILPYCREKRVSLEWVYNARGPVRTASLIAEPGAIYKVETDQDTIYRLSADIYRALLELEGQITPEKFSDIIHVLHRGMLESNEESVTYEKVLGTVKVAV